MKNPLTRFIVNVAYIAALTAATIILSCCLSVAAEAIGITPLSLCLLFICSAAALMTYENSRR